MNVLFPRLKQQKSNFFTLTACLLVMCFFLLQSCFNFGDYTADKHYELKHTKQYDNPDSLFLVNHKVWYKVNSKQTEFSGDFDSLEIENYTIKLYRKGVMLVKDTVMRDIDFGYEYNDDIHSFFSLDSIVNNYYVVNYLDSSNLVLSIDNYKSKWKKEAWFQFSTSKETAGNK